MAKTADKSFRLRLTLSSTRVQNRETWRYHAFGGNDPEARMTREKRSSVDKRAVAGTLTLSNPSYASKLPPAPRSPLVPRSSMTDPISISSRRVVRHCFGRNARRSSPRTKAPSESPPLTQTRFFTTGPELQHVL